MRIPLLNLTGRDLYVLFVAAGLGIIGALWSAFWPETFSPRSLVDLVRQAWFIRNIGNFEKYVEPDAAPVVRVADAIEKLEPDPLRRVYLLPRVTRLVHYRFDYETWGQCFHVASVSQLEEMRKQQGWPALHGDCKAIAVLVASVAKRLRIEYRFARGPLHVWIEVSTPQGWMAINGQGHAHKGVRDMTVADWSMSQGVADQLHRSDDNHTIQEAVQTLLKPPPDPEALDPKRDANVRFSAINISIIPGAVFTIIMLSILVPYWWMKHRNGQSAKSIVDAAATI